MRRSTARSFTISFCFYGLAPDGFDEAPVKLRVHAKHVGDVVEEAVEARGVVPREIADECELLEGQCLNGRDSHT